METERKFNNAFQAVIDRHLKTEGSKVDLDEDGKLRVQGIMHYRGKATKRKTVPTIYGEVPANDEALIIIETFLNLGDYWDGDYSDLVDLPTEEFYPID